VKKVHQRIEVICPLCGKSFQLELDISTYVKAETAPKVEKHDISAVLRSHEEKVDFILRAMRALASKEPSGMVEKEDIVDLGQKVGLTREMTEEILTSEKESGNIYEPKPGVFCFAVPPERSKST
jgi:DNA replicative helicase MCM subunit Mcm2 (Cdc46/Mcm family)